MDLRCFSPKIFVTLVHFKPHNLVVAYKWQQDTLDMFVATKYTMFVATMKVRCKMAGLKKGTRLTDNPKDYTLRVRMDERTLEKLDVCCKEQGLNRSEVVRKGIDEQYAKTQK